MKEKLQDFGAIEQKWQKQWEEHKAFEANPDDRPKFFGNFPYPYINAYSHIGHLFTLMRVEAFNRYKRLTGHNVLFAQGWHATGSPVVQAAKRVKDREPKQIKIMQDMGFSEEDLVKFEEPTYWIEFFAPEFQKDYSALGMSIDWRRNFITTDITPHYDKFIQWQFRVLKEKGYVVQGRFPVVWDPKENMAVGDHDRVEGEGVTTQDFIWGKFRMKNSDLILMAGTTRPDAFYGQTHVWIDPKGDYVVVQVNDEKWVVGRSALDKIHNQYDEEARIIDSIDVHQIIGKWVRGPIVDYDIYVVPASFIDSSVGSGIVYSALEDPVDFFELEKIHSDMSIVDEYGLNKDVVASLKPISIIAVPDMGGNLGKEIGEEFGISSPDQTKKIEEAKGELNRRVFRKGVMKDNCGECTGMTVPDAQAWLKRNLPDRNEAVMFYELQGRVVSRSLTECIVKTVSDQWFIDYANPEWKKKTHECLDKMKLYPEKARAQFDYVIDWLHEWACTREKGLGTRLPWDEKWLIESLSDSTIYMAYYTFAHIIKEMPIDQVTDDLFSYIFYGKDGDVQDREKADEMRRQFQYYYPVDFRNSGKDLIQNHLTFFMFNHVALFDEQYWPKGIGANGWVTVDGQKMSKSLGNMIPIRDAVKKYGADACRFTILSGGEGMDDPNWDSHLAESLGSKFGTWGSFCVDQYGKGREDRLPIDDWMESQFHKVVRDVSGFMEETQFRSALQRMYFQLQQDVKWYMKRCNDNPNKEVISSVIEGQLVMLSPFIPHICEEIWSSLGKDGFVSLASWPVVDQSKIVAEDTELIIRGLINDVNQVKTIAKLDVVKDITVIVSAQWKYDFYSFMKEALAGTRDVKEIIGNVMQTDFKQHSKVVMKLIPKLAKQGYIADVSNQHSEKTAIDASVSYLSETFGAQVHVVVEEDSDNAKAGNAMPSKPAIVLQ